MSLPPLLIILEFARAEHAEDSWAFRFVPQDYLLRTAGGGFERASFSWDEALLLDLEAMRRPGRDPVVVARLGERLRRLGERLHRLAASGGSETGPRCWADAALCWELLRA